MNANKKKGLLLLTSLGTAIIAVGAITLSTAFNNSYSLNAESVVGAKITFDKANSTKSGTTNTTNCNSRSGGNIICKTFNNDSTQSSGYIGAVKSGSTIQFFESDGVTEYTFEDLYYLTLNYEISAFSFDVKGIYDDGSSFSFKYGVKTNTQRKINFTDYGRVSHLRVEVTSDSVTKLTSIELNYNCTSKNLTGLEVTTAPTKTSYSQGESFDPTGMLVKAVYSNDTKVATEAYTVSPSRPLVPSDTQVTISYKGYEAFIPVTVSEVSELTGVYTNSSWSIDFDNCTYTYGSEVLHFTYIFSGTNITFTFVSGDNTAFGSNRLFDGGSTPIVNSTGVLKTSTEITVKTYNAFGGSNTRTFTKQ